MPEPVSVRRRKKHDQLQGEMQQKHERSLFTPSGRKMFRLQLSVDNSSIRKYQLRQSSTASSTMHSPRNTSTLYSPAPPVEKTRPATAASRDQSTRSVGTQTSLEKAACGGAVREKPPGPAERPGSSLSNRSVLYHSRSASCQPCHLYQNEDVRTAAKLNRPPSKVYLCNEREDRIRSTGFTKSPTRFDGSPVEIPGFMQNNGFLRHEDLSMGQKQYIWGVARIYSVTQLMKLKQRQYQSLLDYEFSKRIQNKELKEHERVREWKEYLRYSKFIKCYDQRIPRSKSRESRSPCEDASHIYKHMIKGWTTNPSANDSYRPSSRTSYSSSTSQQPALDSKQRAGAIQPTDCESEHYRLKVVVLSGDRGRPETDSKPENEPKDVTEEETLAQEDSTIHYDNSEAGNSHQESDIETKKDPTTQQVNFL